MSVVKPSIFGEPAPSTYQSFRGLPERQFSASIGFSGTVQLAKAERAMLAYTSVWSRTLLKTKRIQPNDWDRRCSACCRRGGSCATCWAGVIILLVVRGMIVSPEGTAPVLAPRTTSWPERLMLERGGKSLR